MTHLVFVYGSLLEGFGNHGCLGDATLLGEYHTRPGYELRDLGAFPAMSEAADGGQVAGEVYACSDAVLDQLDALEGHPRFYLRTRIRMDDGLEVWAYLLPRPRGSVIPSGSWRQHAAQFERNRAWW